MQYSSCKHVQAEARKPAGFIIWASMQEILTLLLDNNKSADQPAHPHSLISAFIIPYLKNKVTRLLSLHCFGGLQHDKASAYAPDLYSIRVENIVDPNQMASSDDLDLQ